MMRWRPDTCKCIILENSNPVSYHSHEYVCPDHQGMSPAELFIEYSSGSNYRKNTVDRLFRENLTSLLTTTDPNGAIVYKNGIAFNWFFTGTGIDRILNVSISGVTLTTNQKNTIQNICNNLFGVGKVVVG